MKNALIGYTGFVGSNLLKQTSFTDLYNSQNIETIDGKEYDLLVISGAPAVKWLANKEPSADIENIKRLSAALEKVKAKKAVLISTIDVYPTPVNVDENTIIEEKLCHPYGKHRLYLEKFVGDRFDAKILRLPGLFGEGLKKNIIYDYLNNNQIDKIDTRSSFQFYYLDHLWNDIQKFLCHETSLLNLSCAPILTSWACEICLDENPDLNHLGHKYMQHVLKEPISYNVKSLFAEDFGGKEGYCYTQEKVILDLSTYVRKWKNQKIQHSNIRKRETNELCHF